MQNWELVDTLFLMCVAAYEKPHLVATSRQLPLGQMVLFELWLVAPAFCTHRFNLINSSGFLPSSIAGTGTPQCTKVGRNTKAGWPTISCGEVSLSASANWISAQQSNKPASYVKISLKIFLVNTKKPRLLQVRGFLCTTYLWRRMRDSNPRYGYKPYASLAGKCLRPLGQFSTLFALLRCAATEDKIIDGQIYFFKQTTRIF